MGRTGTSSRLGLGLGLVHGGCRIEAAMLPSKIWAAFGVLTELVSSVAAFTKPRPYPRSLCLLYVPRLILSPEPTCPRSSEKLWCEIDVAFAWPAVGPRLRPFCHGGSQGTAWESINNGHCVPPGPYPRLPCCLHIARPSLFPGHGYLTLCAKLWCGMIAQTWNSPHWDRGVQQGCNHQRRALSTIFIGKPVPVYSLQVESLGFFSPSVCASGSPNSPGGLFPPCRNPGLGCPVWGSLPRVRFFQCGHSLPFRSLPSVKVSTLCLVFCPIQLYGNLSCNFGCVGVVLSVFSWLSVRIVTQVDVFWSFCGRSWAPCPPIPPCCSDPTTNTINECVRI